MSLSGNTGIAAAPGLGVGAPATAPAPTTPNPADSTAVTQPNNVANNIKSVVKAAPELANSPGLAVGVAASGGDSTGRAQAVAHATNTISDSNAQKAVSASAGENVLGVIGHLGSDVVSGLKTAGSDVMQTMNKPMSVVQHEYRYLHDVEAVHGRVAALKEGLGLAAGAIVGGAVSGFNPYAMALGAEAAGYLEGQVTYQDSWDRTADGNTYTDPHTHQQVSLGRDIADHLGLRQGTTPYRLSSGLIDGIFDLNVGGTEVLGLANDAKSAEGLEGLLGMRWGGTAIHTLGDAVDGPGITEASEIDRIFSQYGSIRRAASDIASKNTVGELAATPAYRALAPIYDQLAATRSVDDVGQVFKEVMRTHELAMTDRLPSLSWTRLHFGQQLRESIENIGAPDTANADENLTNIFKSTRSPNNIHGPLGMLARQSQRMTQLPVSYDSISKSMKLGEVDPSSLVDDGTNAVYQQARFTETRRVAASIADLYHNAPDLETKVRIFRQLSLNQLFSLAGARGMTRAEYLDSWELSHPGTREAMAKAIDDAVGGGMFGREAVYGVDDTGAPMALVRDRNGDWQYGAGIWENQTGKLKSLNLAEARRAGAALRGAKDVLGRLDDFAYDNITQGIFKPLVLLTPSYAMHIALAEIIPNMLREGVFKIVKAGIEMNLTKLGMRVGELGTVDPDEVSATAALAWKLVTAGRKVLPTTIDDALGKDLALAARELEYTKGTLLGADSGHAYEAEVANREDNSISLLRKEYANSSKTPTSRAFATIGKGDTQYMDAWQKQLAEIAKAPSGQFAAKEMIAGANRGENIETASKNAQHALARYLRDEVPTEETGKFLRSNDAITMAPKGQDRMPDQDAFDEFAAAKIAALRGAVRGADRSIDGRLLASIADGRIMTDQELNEIPEVARPALVKGRELLPATSGKVQQIANVGFRRVLNPMVNFLSRQPIFWNEFKRQWSIVEPLVNAGVMDDDEAWAVANDRAVNRVLRNVHNLTDRTQWTVTLRNWAPFYFAQEQAYRRMGRLLAENPRAFRQYQLMISNVGNLGQVFQGPNGTGYFVMPGTGFLTSGALGAAAESAVGGAIIGGAARGPIGAAIGGAAAGLGVAGILAKLGIPLSTSSPIGMGWNLSASSVIFPLSAGVRPDLGPLVAIGTDGLAAIFNAFVSPKLQSDLTATTNIIMGPDATEQWYEEIIPNTIAQRLLTASIPSFDERSFYSTQMQTLATLEYENQIPAPTAGYWAFQKFLDRWQNMTTVSYIAKALVGAITPVSPEATVPTYNFFEAELTNDINATGSFNKGLAKYLKENPDATPFTTFQSTNPTGVSVPASVAAENWIDENMGLIKSSKGAALLLLPPNTNANYNAAVYDAQIAQGMRTKWFPGEALPNGELEGYLGQLYTNAGDAIVWGQWYPQFEKQIAGLSGSAKIDAENNFYGNGEIGSGTLGKYGLMNPVWWNNQPLKNTQRGELINNMKTLLASPNAPKSQIADYTQTLLSAYDAYETTYNQDQAAGRGTSQLTAQWHNTLYEAVAAYPEITNVVTGLFLSLPSTAKVPATAPGENQGSTGTFNAKNWAAA